VQQVSINLGIFLQFVRDILVGGRDDVYAGEYNTLIPGLELVNAIRGLSDFAISCPQVAR
jgi:hypothetical protein